MFLDHLGRLHVSALSPGTFVGAPKTRRSFQDLAATRHWEGGLVVGSSPVKDKTVQRGLPLGAGEAQWP